MKGPGEGIVWCGQWHVGSAPERQWIRFKVKGEQHRIVKKTAGDAQVDTEKLASVQAFVAYACTEARLLQALTEVFVAKGLTVALQHTGTFIGWVWNDVLKEESHAIAENGIEIADAKKAVGAAARAWLVARVNHDCTATTPGCH